MLIVNLFALTHNIILLIINCNLLLSLITEKLILICVSSANSITLLLIEKVGMSLMDKEKGLDK